MRNDLISQAAELAEECCPQAMQDFAWRLRGLGNCHLTTEAMRLVPDLFLPADFFHVRYTTYEVIETGADGVYLLGKPNCAGELIQASLEPIELVDLVRTAQVMAESMYATSMGPGRWIESFALPIKDPGVFELALVVEPHEVNDGSEAARIKPASGSRKGNSLRVQRI